MKHGRDFLNGRRYILPRLSDEFEEELPPLEPYSKRTVMLIWMAAFIAGGLTWYALIRGIIWAFSV